MKARIHILFWSMTCCHIHFVWLVKHWHKFCVLPVDTWLDHRANRWPDGDQVFYFRFSAVGKKSGCWSCCWTPSVLHSSSRCFSYAAPAGPAGPSESRWVQGSFFACLVFFADVLLRSDAVNLSSARGERWLMGICCTVWERTWNDQFKNDKVMCSEIKL